MARRVLHDTFFKQAKAEGYVARSAYKLQQIQEAKRLIKKSDKVLDLGCAPGAWLQVAAELVGTGGAVVGIDLQTIVHRFGGPVPIRHVVGDVFKTPASVLLDELAVACGMDPAPSPATSGGGSDPAPKPLPPHKRADVAPLIPLSRDVAAPPRQSPRSGPMFDVVLSDMAPNTTGHGDHERSIALCDRVVELLPDLLKRGGACAIKVFEGGDYPRLLKDMAGVFEAAKGYKPEASRAVSKEMYIVATGYRGRPVRRTDPL